MPIIRCNHCQQGPWHSLDDYQRHDCPSDIDPSQYGDNDEPDGGPGVHAADGGRDLSDMQHPALMHELRRLYGLNPYKNGRLSPDELRKIVRQTRQRHTLDTALRTDGGRV